MKINFGMRVSEINFSAVGPTHRPALGRVAYGVIKLTKIVFLRVRFNLECKGPIKTVIIQHISKPIDDCYYETVKTVRSVSDNNLLFPVGPLRVLDDTPRPSIIWNFVCNLLTIQRGCS